MPEPKDPRQKLAEPIAIIGMACRFPGGANDPETYFEQLLSGQDAIREVPSDRWDIDAFYDPNPEAPGKMYSRCGGFLDEIDRFDARFFNISPREANELDPQQRLLLELAWETLEDAGYPVNKIADSRAAVFIGICTNDYTRLGDHDVRTVNAYTATGNSYSVAAGRISFFLGATGPSIAIDTACSSSLVALHLACQSLSAGESRLAMVGGVNMLLAPAATVACSSARMLSRAGRCKTFDASADGYVRGEGGGMLLLKPLSAALADHDRVLAVVRGSAVNQSGRVSSLTVPNGIAQSAVIRAALAAAGVTASALDYLEAHGTGTALGDPIEGRALGAVFANRSNEHPLWVGSVKANIGHLEAAAGIAGVIKVVQALRQGKLPPQLHIKQINPHIHLQELGLAISTQVMPWPEGASRMAGVSSFGFSGTNAHVILEEAPTDDTVRLLEDNRALHLLPLGAHSEQALVLLASRYRRLLTGPQAASLPEICHGAATGRTHLPTRTALLAGTAEELRESLAALETGGVTGRKPRRRAPRVAFLFTGQGSLYAGMGRVLAQTEPGFQRVFEECARLVSPYLEVPLKEVMGSERLLQETCYVQPVLFSLEYALAELWRSWGVQPVALLGHSIGELVAACVAGVFSLEDGLRLSVRRGRAMQDSAAGAMAVVLAPAGRVEPLIAAHRGEAAIAAINSPQQTTIAGTPAAIAAICERLAADGVTAELLQVSRAFHSPLLDPVLDQIERAAETVSFKSPRVKLISTLSGVVAGEEVSCAGYWRRQAREPVLFAAAMEALRDLGCDAVLEIGPHPTLLTLGQRCWPEQQVRWLPSLQRGEDDWRCLLTSLAALYELGAEVNWTGFYRDRPQGRVKLPSYPFVRQRFWLPALPLPQPASLSQPGDRAEGSAIHPLIDRRLPLARDEVYFEKYIRLEREPLLGEHRVLGKVLLPAVAYLEMALAGGQQWGGTEYTRLSDVEFMVPLVLEPDAEVRVQMVLEPDSQGASFRILSHGAGASPYAPASPQISPTWTEHARGHIRRRLHTAARVDMASIFKGCQSPVPAEEFYTRYKALGIDLGSRFKCLRSLRLGTGEGIARLEVDGGLPPGYSLQLPLADGGLQALGATLLGNATAAEQEFYFPFSVKEVSLFRALAGAAFCHVRSAHRGPAPGFIRGELCYLDDQGDPLLELKGVCARRVPATHGAKPAGLVAARPVPRELGGWFYTATWEPAPPIRPQPTAPGSWLVFADDLGIAEALCERWHERGSTGILTRMGARYERLGHDRYVINPESTDDYERLVRSVQAGVADFRGCVHLWTCASPPSDARDLVALEGELTKGVYSLLFLTQALMALGSTPTQLWVSSSYSQALSSPLATPLVPERAALRGLLRVIAKECPRFKCRHLDLSLEGLAPGALAEVILAEMDGTGVAEVAWQEGKRWLPRWRTADPSAQPRRLVSKRDEGVYLITGGQGGIGLELGRQLAADGGRPRLVLLNRTALPPEAEWEQCVAREGSESRLGKRLQGIRELRQAGAQVWPVTGDVSDVETMRALFREIDACYGRLNGIVHAAGLIQDGLIQHLKRPVFADVLSPKVQGSWLLHQLSRGRELDFFVMCSSAATIGCPPGQGNYAAANAFQDLLAHYRRSQDLPALAINWGHWGETGLAASERYHQLMRAVGLRPIASKEGRAAFEIALELDSAQVAIVHLTAPLTTQDAAEVSLPDQPPEPVAAAVPPLSATPSACDPVVPSDFDKLAELAAAKLLSYISEALQLPEQDIDPTAKFSELGLDSLMAMRIKNSLEKTFGLTLEPTLLFEYSTLNNLAGYLAREHRQALLSLGSAQAGAVPPERDRPPALAAAELLESPSEPAAVPAGQAVPKALPPAESVASSSPVRQRDIAIIGMACRLPGARSPEEFFGNLRTGASYLTPFPDHRRPWLPPCGPTRGKLRAKLPGWGGFIDEVEYWDADFFGLSAEEALPIDPQQRLLMEVAWEALERAGYSPERLARRRTGVFVGAANNDYNQCLARQDVPASAQELAGNALCMLSNRLSYFLDLTGPSLTVDTACPSALVALHLGVHSLRSGECEAALIAGVNLIMNPDISVLFNAAGVLSPDGSCRSFDDDAKGYPRSEGVGVLLIKPLAAALRDQDTICAVLKGTGLAHDGQSTAGIAIPGTRGQREAIRAALRDAEVDPASLGYLEAHGTASAIGDALEVRALTLEHREHTKRSSYCALGSVKYRIGHSESASGISSIMTAALALSRQLIPPSLDIRVPNRHILFEDTPFYLSDRARPWQAGMEPRRAALHSYGLGGVNVHVILEEAPPLDAQRTAEARPGQLLPLSARSEAALRRLVAAYRMHLTADVLDFRDVCHTAGVGRRHFPVRLALLVHSREHAIAQLRLLEDQSDWTQHTDPLVWRATGQAPADNTSGLAELQLRLASLPEQGQMALRRWCSGPWFKRVIAARLPEQNTKLGKEKGRESQPLLDAQQWTSLLSGVATLYTRGVDVDWEAMDLGLARRCVPLPTYPFERRALWFVSPAAPSAPAPTTELVRPAVDPPAEAMDGFLLRIIAIATRRPLSAVTPQARLLSLGVDSVAALRAAFLIEQTLRTSVSITALFEHPTVESLSAYLLSQGAVVPDLSQDELTGLARPEAAAGQQDDDGPFPSTELQQAYLAARLVGWPQGEQRCLMYIELELYEVPDEQRLKRSVEALLRRHPMLRAVFLADGRQRILKNPPAAYSSIDLRHFSQAEQTVHCLAIRQTLLDQRPDPQVGPLCQFRVAVLSERSFLLFISIDMLIVDFHSLCILLDEWRRLYLERELILPPLDLDFRSYIGALVTLRSAPRYDQHRTYWKALIADFPPPPPLPLRIAPAGVSRPRFASQSLLLSAQAWDGLRATARRLGVSSASLLGAAYCNILRQWSGAQRFCLNLPTFDRLPIIGRFDEVDHIVGPFSGNILVDVASTEEGIEALARSFQRTCQEALDHRLFTGVEFARALAQHRRSGLPAGPVVFTAALYGARLPSWGQVRASFSQTPQVWLDCQVFEQQDELHLRWDYAEDLFEPAELAARFQQFSDLVLALSRGDVETQRVPLPPALIPAAAPTVSVLLHELVLAQAKRTPHARAVAEGERYLTYSQLTARAGRIAQVLREHDVSSGQRVALLLDRGCDLVAAILGVLLAGAAYVPIDPDSPARRVAYLLEDSRPQLVVTSHQCVHLLSRLGPRHLEIEAINTDATFSIPQSKGSSDDLAYIIYTSGSSGSPKGVMISHASAANTILDINRRFSIGAYDRVLGLSSAGFDLSVYDLFGTLAAGGTLVTLPRSALKDPQRWLSLIEEEGVTVWNSVPTAMKMLVECYEGQRREISPTLRVVLLSGDWIPVSLPAQIRRCFPEAQVVSLGGATEASIWSCIYPIDQVDPKWTSIPYGTALSGQSLHIRDAALAAVRDGEIGEICIGGHGVALGYWHEPALTRKSFVTDPRTGQRLYRTGDLGRRHPDGNFEILGRTDLQLKVRGFRVDLTEIETALASHEAVDACAVVASGGREDEKELAAYYKLKQPVESSALRQHLRSLLPEYMIPQRFVPLPALPLNENGKVDRKALHAKTR